MTDIEDALAQLREQFLRGSQRRLDEMEELLVQLANDPQNAGLLRDLLRRFHGFAGSGSTYGFPEVSAAGLHGELACSALQSQGGTPSRAAIRGLGAALDRIRGALLGEPRRADVLLPGPASSAPTPPPPFDVLVADDDPLHLETLRVQLAEEGIVVRSAATLDAVKAAIEARLPDGLITDVLLPDGSGYDAVRYLRGRPGGELPATLITSKLTGFLDKVEAAHCGADGFFEKPLDWEALMRRLQHLLERTRVATSRVMYVEDDPGQGAFVSVILESAGYQVRVLDDPSRFEAELMGFRPDLILMDVLLPGPSGYDLARYVRQQEQHATLPIVFVTTRGEDQARIDAARAGGDEHLVKPVTPGVLLSAVAARIERARFLKALLSQDGLTRLLSHSGFLARARAIVIQRVRTPQRPAVWVMVDVDHFKDVNDRFGHPVGDRVLTSLAALLRRRLRQSDTIGRYGGDEFAILLEDLNQEEAMRLVSRLREEFSEQIHRPPRERPSRSASAPASPCSRPRP